MSRAERSSSLVDGQFCLSRQIAVSTEWQAVEHFAKAIWSKTRLVGKRFGAPLHNETLFMLVSALMGRERMQGDYTPAIAAGYRFYSYGDASLLLP